MKKKNNVWLWVGAGALTLFALSSSGSKPYGGFGSGGGSPLFGGFMGGGDLDTTSKKDNAVADSPTSPVYNFPSPSNDYPLMFDVFKDQFPSYDGGGGGSSKKSYNGGSPVLAIDFDTFSRSTQGIVPSKKDNIFGVQTYEYNPNQATNYGIASLQAGYWNLGGVPTAGNPTSSGGSSTSKKATNSMNKLFNVVPKTSKIYNIVPSKTYQGVSSAFPSKKDKVFTGLPVSQA